MPTTPRPDLILRLRAGRFPSGIRCPRCGAPRAHRWGSFRDRQRYRCLGCGRTFSDLTGTPAAYLKRLDALAQYADCLTAGLSIRRVAGQLGIHPSTAFRWRHRLTRRLAETIEPLAGHVEVVELLTPESMKGQRRLPRPARRRGIGRPSYLPPRVCVAFIADRSGSAGWAHFPSRPSGSRELEVACDRLLARGATIIALEGRMSPWGTMARRRGGVFLDARGEHVTGLTDLRRAQEYRASFATWVRRFRGVATKYLDHYLAWHRTGDRLRRLAISSVVLTWPIPP